MAEEDIREIRIIKVPREKPPAVWPTNFRELDVNSLGLNHLEIKQKLKPNPPTLKSVVKKEVPPAEPVKKVTPSPSKPKVKKAATEDELLKAFAESKEEFSEYEGEDDEDEEVDEIEEAEEEVDDDANDNAVDSAPEDDDEELELNFSEEDGENQEVEEALAGEPKTVIEEAPPEETEDEKKRRILRRLRTLKKIHPSANIPDFDYEDDLDLMTRVLDDVAFDLKIDQNVSFYRTILYGYFGGVEFLSGFLDYDMVGFASSQIKIMNRYDSLLMELAEKNSGGWTSNLPVEVRLLGLVVLNTAIYFLFRYISNTKGAAAGNAFMGIYDSLPAFAPAAPSGGGGGGVEASAPRQTQTPKAKATPTYRGPSVNLKDLEERLGSTEESEEISESE